MVDNRTGSREIRGINNQSDLRSQQQPGNVYQNDSGISAMKPPVATKLSQRTEDRMISISNANLAASEEGSNFMTPKRTWV